MFTKTLNGPATQLAEIQYFLKCDVKIEGNFIQSFWFVALSFYYPHECRVWFGNPTEVWSAVASPDYYFLPLSYIQSRVAYSKQKINFGQVIGTDSVLVITPLALCH